MGAEALRVGFVPGVMPDTWARRWAARNRRPLDLRPLAEHEQPVRLLDERELDMALLRLPVTDDADLHVVRLYDEQPVVVVAREHPVAAYDQIDVSDLVDEHLLQDPADVPAWRDVATELRQGTRHPVPAMSTAEAFASVAAGAGVLVVPRSLARLHHRRDVAAVPVTGVAESTVALVWRRDRDDDACQEMVAVVRGRSPRSSRG